VIPDSRSDQGCYLRRPYVQYPRPYATVLLIMYAAVACRNQHTAPSNARGALLFSLEFDGLQLGYVLPKVSYLVPANDVGSPQGSIISLVHALVSTDSMMPSVE